MTVKRPFRFGVVLSEPVELAQLIDDVQEFEASGYSEFSISDHLHQDFAQLAPLPTLAALAQHTRSIGLSTLVLANDFRHPAVLANEAASLSRLSGGRFTLGLGAGWFAPDFTASGITFRQPAERVARLSETIDILRGLHSGELFSFEGQHYCIREMRGQPLPEVAPLPLLVGASGPVMLSLAVRKADIIGLNPGLPLSWGPWREGPTPYADATDRKLQWIRRAAPDNPGKVELQSQVIAGGITAGDPGQLLAPIASMMGVETDQFQGCPHFLAGTEEQCLADLRGWRERWGINYITFTQAMARQMAPLVKALAGTCPCRSRTRPRPGRGARG